MPKDAPGSFVNPTNLSIADLIIGAPDHKEAMKFLTKWYSDMVDLPPSAIKELIIDGNTVFPILHGDTLEMILKRFALLYPVLAKESIRWVKDMAFENPDGQSGAKLLRSLVSIPPILKAAICTFYGQNCFTDRVFLKRFAREAPKYFTCNVSKI